MTNMLADWRADRRAERAEALLLHEDAADRAAARRRTDELHALQLQGSAQAEKDARRRVERSQRDARRLALKDARAARWQARLDKAPALGRSALWAVLIVLPIAQAWTAQAAFAADTLHMPFPFNHLFPASIETGAWVCVFEARRRTRDGKSAGTLTTWVWLLAGIAAVINGAHGTADGGPVAGLALAVLSLLGVILHTVRQGRDKADVTGSRPGLALWRRARYPRLSLAAASLRAARELDHDTAWTLAWTDRFGVGPDATRRERRLAREIVKREVQEDEKGARAGELTIVGGHVQPVMAPQVNALLSARQTFPRYTLPAQLLPMTIADAGIRTSEVPNPENPDATVTSLPAISPGEPTLSPRAAELLPKLRQAIATGALPAAVGVKKIQAFFEATHHEALGVPTAQQLRDAIPYLELPAAS
ncbi:hypothetical protein [Amycolatopsis sp. NBC_01286]|uniref:hypothetical protein n=1 Tax=Amycolatopsis sp. NBC_01286 TaxID=2903560 RepID=UPI002E1181D0|nr:hypothetical protein OG570_48165 [Amycolatopsis sp. NBC_01286]